MHDGLPGIGSSDISLEGAGINRHHSLSEYNGIPPSILNTPTDLDLWDLGLNTHEPSWLLGEDFDVDALNYSITATISDWGYAHPVPTGDQQRMYDAANTLYQFNAGSPASALGTVVQQNWYTKVAPEVPAQSASRYVILCEFTFSKLQ